MEEKDTHVTLPIDRYEHLIRLEKSYESEHPYIELSAAIIDYTTFRPGIGEVVEFAKIHTKDEALKKLAEDLNLATRKISSITEAKEKLDRDKYFLDEKVRELQSTLKLVREERDIYEKRPTLLGLYK